MYEKYLIITVFKRFSKHFCKQLSKGHLSLIHIKSLYFHSHIEYKFNTIPKYPHLFKVEKRLLNIIFIFQRIRNAG